MPGSFPLTYLQLTDPSREQMSLLVHILSEQQEKEQYLTASSLRLISSVHESTGNF